MEQSRNDQRQQMMSDLKSATKNHLQKTGDYARMKAFIAATLYQQLLSQDSPVDNDFSRTKLSQSDRNDLEFVMKFLTEHNLTHTLKVLKLEADITGQCASATEFSANNASESMSLSPNRYGEVKNTRPQEIPVAPRKVVEFDSNFDDIQVDFQPKQQKAQIKEEDKQEFEELDKEFNQNNELDDFQDLNEDQVIPKKENDDFENFDDLDDLDMGFEEKPKKAEPKKAAMDEFDDLDDLDMGFEEKPKKAEPKKAAMDEFDDLDNFDDLEADFTSQPKKAINEFDDLDMDLDNFDDLDAEPKKEYGQKQPKGEFDFDDLDDF
uniref:Uncharacterized protein n=1 Tax=Spironucleus salmonicida TaxID=348837 RepID=V6LMJ5_9EUKA|eukprot:EST41934.1 Hypothetical protein SS50377_18238 [Spironucleus salmonicida]